jgi:hypothetical protein
MTLAWGAKARDRRHHPGPIVFRPLMVKGVFCALTGRAAFLFRGKFKRPFPPAACAHPVPPGPPPAGAPHAQAGRSPGRARGAPRHGEPPPASPEHEVGRGPARDVAGSRPAPQGLDRTRGLETGSNEGTPAEKDGFKRGMRHTRSSRKR